MARGRKSNQGDVITTPFVDNDTVKPIKAAQIEIADDEEIEVISYDSHISYYDKNYDETYVWDNVGDIVYMPFGAIRNMWRNNKDYFKNYCIRPNDQRVIDKLGLGKVYEKYDFLMNGSNYTKENLDEIVKTLKSTSVGFRSSIYRNIQNMIQSGEISNASVIVRLGKMLDVDFIDLID